MHEKNMMYQMIVEIINANQLSALEEKGIKRIIWEREGKRRGRCLAGIIESQMAKEVAGGSMNETLKNRLTPIVKKCFLETKVGNMDASELSEKIVMEYIDEFSCLGKDEMTDFMRLLQGGLNSMSNRGILDFIPDCNMLQKYIDSKKKINYIENPYSPEETEKIIAWVREHPVDVMGIAIELLFHKGISMTEIVNLTKKDCWGENRVEDSMMEFDHNLFKGSTRAKIVRKSLDMHPKKIDIVFVVPTSDGRGWKKLTEKGLQLKLYHICDDLGIVYRKIGTKEAIKLDK